MVDNTSHRRICHLRPELQDKQVQTEELPLPGVLTVESQSSSMLNITPTDPGLYPAQIPLNHQPSDIALKQHSPSTAENCLDKVFTPLDCTVAAQHAYSSTLTHTSNAGQGLLAQGQLGNVKGNKDVGPNELAQLRLEYSSTETSIMSILSLGELTADLIVDRGEDSRRRYHLVKATMDNIGTVVMAQQTFVQRAAALIMERCQFIVDPRDTLIPILRGTSSLPQLYVAWKTLMARMRLGVKTWGKYVAEYQLQMGAHC